MSGPRSTSRGDEDPPLLRVVHGGEPTAEETAALVAAVALRSAAPAVPRPMASRWASHDAALRRPLTPGPGAWVASARH